MIYVDESAPEGDPESQFCHRKVQIKRSRDVRSHFHMLNEIGRGKFGKVWRCREFTSGQIFAAKFVTCNSREDRRNVEREVEIMNDLASSRLLQLYDAFENGRGEMCLITEYVAGGELFDRVIEDEFVLTELACACFMKQILEGVAYMHQQEIIHLDLKPENILCLTKCGNRIKIIDFGLARKFEPMKKLQVLFGTPEFVAPEVVSFEPIGYATDMWAVGVICYVLLSGLSPFMGDTDLETMANVTIAEYDYEDEAFDNVSEEAKNFIDTLLVKDKRCRATAEESLRHPWIQQLGCQRSNSCSSLMAAKQNLSTNREHFEESGHREFIFDRPSKTVSVAVEDQEITDLSPVEPKDIEEIYLGTACAVVPSTSTDSIKSIGSAVITLDQIRKKAEEICERKNSFCSSSLVQEDLDADLTDDIILGDIYDANESDDTDNDDEANTPKCDSPMEDTFHHVDLNELYNAEQVVPKSGNTRITSPIDIYADSIIAAEFTEPLTPKAKQSFVEFSNSRESIPTSKSEIKALMEYHEQPLWQAAERTVSTPLWELVNATASSSPSTTMSKSNSELSLRSSILAPRKPNKELMEVPHKNLSPLDIGKANHFGTHNNDRHRALSDQTSHHFFHSDRSTTSSGSSGSWDRCSVKSSDTGDVANRQGQNSTNTNTTGDSGLLLSPQLSEHVNDANSPRSWSPDDGFSMPNLEDFYLKEVDKEDSLLDLDKLLASSESLSAKQSQKRTQSMSHSESSLPCDTNAIRLTPQSEQNQTCDDINRLNDVNDDDDDDNECKAIEAELDSLLAEVDKNIRFSSAIEESRKQASNKDKDREDKLLAVKHDLSEVRKDINQLKRELNRAKKFLREEESPIMSMMSDVVKPLDSGFLTTSGEYSSDENYKSVHSGSPKRKRSSVSSSKEIQEAEKAMAHLAQTISDFNSSLSNTTSRQEIFRAAQNGSVNQAKAKFERKSCEPFQKPRQHSGTPFRSASPNNARNSLRRRSPSPVKTGKVDQVRSRFEPAGLNEVMNGHQTLPRTFKVGRQPPSAKSAESPGPIRRKKGGHDAPTICSLNKVVTPRSRTESPGRHSYSFGCYNKPIAAVNGGPIGPSRRSDYVHANGHGGDSLAPAPQPPPRAGSMSKVSTPKGHQTPATNGAATPHSQHNTNGSGFSLRSLSERFMSDAVLKEMRDAASFLSQRLPGALPLSHPMKSPALVNSYMKAPFRVSEG